MASGGPPRHSRKVRTLPQAPPTWPRTWTRAWTWTSALPPPDALATTTTRPARRPVASTFVHGRGSLARGSDAPRLVCQGIRWYSDKTSFIPVRPPWSTTRGVPSRRRSLSTHACTGTLRFLNPVLRANKSAAVAEPRCAAPCRASPPSVRHQRRSIMQPANPCTALPLQPLLLPLPGCCCREGVTVLFHRKSTALVAPATPEGKNHKYAIDRGIRSRAGKNNSRYH